MRFAKTLLISKYFCVAALVSLTTQSYAENPVEQTLKAFSTNKTLEGYTQPLQDLFAANMTSGWYRSAEIPQSGFNISVNIVAMGALLSDDQKTFDYTSPNTGSKFPTATLFGGKRGVDANGIEFGPADGVLNTSIFPLATLQGTIGHVQGTELIVRFVPLPEISNLPKITYWGIGGRHSISQYFSDGDEPPIHVALGVFYNQLTFGDFATAKSFLVGPQVSKRFAILELYGGFGYTKNTMELDFTSSALTAPNNKIHIELEGEDKVRGTVGAALNLGILHLHADVNLGSVTAISTSLGFGF